MTSRLRFLWLALGLLPLGCPLLTGDDFELVDADDATAGARNEAPTSAGAPAMPAMPTRPCPAMCDSCEGSVCVLSCSGDAVCKDRMITCPATHACRLVCSGKSACDKVRLACPRTLPCSVECADAKDACKGMNVTCGTGRCEAECHDDVEAPTLECGKSSACTGCP